MSQPRPSNWRSVPAFNHEHATLGDCVASAIKEFGNRITTVFLILRHNTLPIYFLMPWSQYRSIPSDHPAAVATALFKGSIIELRQIAFSFPPDLLNHFPALEDESESADTHDPEQAKE